MTTTPTLESILGRGYFPVELPPPFSTMEFGSYASSLNSHLPFNTNDDYRISRPEIFNLARAGSLRRELSIPNPIHYSLLTEFVLQNWSDLIARTGSDFSLTSPTPTPTGRAISRGNPLDELPNRRARLRSKGKFSLFADVARFYPSIYTHSIAWAAHDKPTAKAAFRTRPRTYLWGDRLDTLLRNCQDAQSVGIPIGPDISLVIAEMILAQVDQVLSAKGFSGIRYIDDYELVFETQREALEARSILQGALLEFELDLNASKTRVVALPQELEEPWIGSLRDHSMLAHSRNFEKQIIRFFDHAFELSKQFPNEGVLKYAAGKMAKVSTYLPKHQELIENLLIQCAQVESGSLAFVLASILKHPNVTSEMDKVRKRMLLRVVADGAPQRHSSEVAWAVWGCVVLGYPLTRDAVRSIVSMDDSICALLALHAKEKGLVREPKDLQPLREDLNGSALYGPRWLLAYEAPRKGWFRFTGQRDYIKADPNFSLLRAAGVSFYDRSKVELPGSPEMVDEYVSRITKSRYSEEDEDYDEDSDPFYFEDDDHSHDSEPYLPIN